MSNEFNLTLTEALEVAVDGGMIVGDNFSSGFLAKVNLFGFVSLFLYSKPEEKNPRERDFSIGKSNLKAKYKQINNISEAFIEKD